MEPARGARALAASRRQRHRRRACRRGDDDQGPLPLSTVTLYTAPGCHLCELARRDLAALQAELGFDVHEVSIAGDAGLERAYRPLIPVVEVEGERVSVFRVEPEALRSRLAGAARPPERASQTGPSRPSL